MLDMPSGRMKTYMEIALDRTCLELPHGGGHELRRFIAYRLIGTARAGHATFGELGIAARKALADYQAIQRELRVA